MPAKPPVGVLISNLGSPEAPTAAAVRPYLRQFLTDRRVIDIPWLPRQMLVRGIIAPFRSGRSAHAYRRIWSERGSPLVAASRDLEAALAGALGPDFRVALGMRYGNPSLDSALTRLEAEGCREVRLVPLYPQEASATTGSTLEEVWRLASHRLLAPRVLPWPAFPTADFFVVPQARAVREAWETLPSESRHVLFSFHGLPERQVRAADPTGNCLREGCCDAPGAATSRCYRAQCHATARALARSAGLPAGDWSVSFQSRLGRTPWLRPYTDETVRALPGRGVRHLAVACPSFVADCLETLEEIGMGVRGTFLASGGEGFARIPCLDADPEWVVGLAEWIRNGPDMAGDPPEG